MSKTQFSFSGKSGLISSIVTLLLMLSNISLANVACFTPSNVQTLNADNTSVELSWNDFTTTSEFIRYEISYNLISETPDITQFDSVFQKNVILNNLIDGQTYEIRLRTVCTTGTSDWSSPTLFHTIMDFSNNCGINLVIPDNSCNNTHAHPFNIDQGDLILGEDIFIKEIRFSIGHDWPADLEAHLVSPDGISVNLFSDKGIGTQNIGNIQDFCNDPLVLDMNACESIDEHSGPLIGSLRPTESLEDFYNGSSVSGTWALNFCDDASGQVGRIKYFEMIFATENCSGPEDVFLNHIEANSASVIIPESACDSLEILYMSLEDGIEHKVYVNCIGDTLLLENLNPGEEYLLQYSPMCAGSLFSISCPKNFQTRCTTSSIYSDFNSTATCSTNCETTCIIDDLWMNTSDKSWIVNEGATNTQLTGPSSDFHGNGQYMYVEASSNCETNKSILTSPCLIYTEENDCQFSYAYHMYGSDIGILEVEISLDNGDTWFPLQSYVGDQGNQWHEETIQFSLFFKDKPFQLQFVATETGNNLGDIALDEIVLSGVSVLEESSLTWYRDEDNDGYGSNLDSIQFCSSDTPIGYSLNNGDCDDNNSNINPAAIESPCNIIDDNCNGEIDETSGGTNLAYEIINIENQTCLGMPNGSIQIIAKGGIEPYTYIWSDGIIGSERDNLSSGNYYAVIQDGSGCQIITDSIYIDLLQSFDFLISSTQPASCQGINDGQITIIHDEDNGPYSYEWNNGETNKDIFNQAVGTYKLSITDINECVVETDEIIIEATKIIKIQVDSISTVQCFNGNNGFIGLSNDSIALEYIWEDGSLDSIRSELEAGMYSVTATDSRNCFTPLEFEILEPDMIQVEIISNEPINCFGENTGLIEIDINGGNGPFEMIWSNGDETDKIENLLAGNYKVTITDINLCQDSSTVVQVDQADALSIEVLETQPEICSNNNGSIEIEVQGGNENYTYLWSDGKDHNTLADTLSSGLYTITVIDKFECKTSLENLGVSSITTELINSLEDKIDVSCFGLADGFLQIEVENVTTAPTYLLFNQDTIESNNNLFDIENISSGLYEYYSVDGNGCISANDSIIITQPDELLLEIENIENIDCFGLDNGAITIKKDGGTAPFFILWSNGIEDDQIDQLASGSYSVTIEDVYGCIDSLENILITEPEELIIEDIVLNDPKCYGESTGNIKVNHNGGSSPFFYSINNSLSDTSLFDNLAEGQYQIEIIDGNDCPSIDTIISLINPTLLNIQLDSIKSSVCDGDNGFIYTSIVGGTGSIRIDWNNEDYKDKTIIENIAQGFYTVNIEDSNGCLDSLVEIEIENVDRDLELVLDPIDSLRCFDSNDGTISGSLLGFEISYPIDIILDENIYSTETDSAFDISDLEKGIYSIKVVDRDGCVDSLQQVTINSPDTIRETIKILSEVLCYKDTTGILNISAIGGTGSLRYLWNNEVENDTIFNLGKGFYQCAILDENNCVYFTDSVELIEPDSLYINLELVNATGSENNGAIYIQTFGGTHPYSYIWEPELPISADTVESLSESDWTLSVVDNNGCQIDTAFSIQRIVNSEETEYLNAIVFPNPTSGQLNIEFQDYIKGEIEVYSTLGVLIKKETFSERLDYRINLFDFDSGEYYVFIKSEKGTFYRKILVVR